MLYRLATLFFMTCTNLIAIFYSKWPKVEMQRAKLLSEVALAYFRLENGTSSRFGRAEVVCKVLF